MRKKSREMDSTWALEVMHNAPYITVSFIDAEGNAYGLPLSLASGDDLHWYFHGALEGKKLDAIASHPEVCLTAVTRCTPTVGPKDGSFTLQFKSAVAFGKAEIVEDREEKIRGLRLICERFLPEHIDAFESSIERSLDRTAVVRITLSEPPVGKRKQYDSAGEEMKWGRTEANTCQNAAGRNEEKIIVGLGEALWDCLPDGRKIGGAPANFAYHASQFGYEAYVVSAVGNDALGDETIEILQQKGLKLAMPRVDFPTGQVQVTLDDKGVATYDIREGSAWDNIPFTPEIEQIAKRCRAVCFGSLAQRNEVSRNTIRRFLENTPQDALRIFDINLRQNFYSKEVIEESLHLCNILKINDEELVIIGRMFGFEDTDAETICRHIIGQYGIDKVILTCGTDGSYVFSEHSTSYRETPEVKVADTVGAGDSFTGSFVASTLSGKSMTDAHRIAVGISAYVCTQDGAMPQIPDELRR